MNTECESMILRQFDADCRDNENLPADVVQHLALCPSCKEEWSTALQFDQQLRVQMKVTPDNQLFRRSYIAALHTDDSGRHHWFWWQNCFIAIVLGIAIGSAFYILGESSAPSWLSFSIAVFTSATVFLLGLLMHIREHEPQN